jgi:glycine betaine catabolism B
MLNLQIIHPSSGTIATQEIDLERHPMLLIGRHPNCSIWLDRPEISRIHGQLQWQDDRLTYSDLGSTDGSKINNQPITINQLQVLRSGDTLQIGEYLVLVLSIAVETPQAAPVTLRCIQVIDQTPDVKTFRWIADIPFDYRPGQFVTFQVTIAGQTVTRCYSISSSPSRPEILEFTVKRVGAARSDLPVGLVSNWLHETVGLGFELPILGIAGEFTCGGRSAIVPDKILLLSAGSGITPMLSIIRWLCDMAYSADIILLHTVRHSADIVARSELVWLASLNPRLHLRFTVTQPEANWSGLVGRVDAAMLQGIADLRDRQVYVCGPDAFMAGMKATLLQLGLPASQYQEESFGGPSIGVAQPTAPEAETNNVIEFTQSQKSIRPQTDESILDAGLRSGVRLKHGCRMGVCGVCKLKRQSGQVNYSRSPSGLQGDTVAFVLPCVACAVDRVVLEA